jgi:hypothetical protein
MATASNIPSVQAVLDGLKYRSPQIEVGNTNELGKWVSKLKDGKVDTTQDVSFLFKMTTTPIRIGLGFLFNSGTEAQALCTDGSHLYVGHTNMAEEFEWDEIDHESLRGREELDQHPEKSITGLVKDLADRVLKASIRESAGGKREVVTGLDIISVTKSGVKVRQYKSNVDDGMATDHDMDLWVADLDKAGLFGSDQLKSLQDAIEDIIKLYDLIDDEEVARKEADDILSKALIEETRRAREAESNLDHAIKAEATTREAQDNLRIEKDAISVSGNKRRQVVTALDFEIGADSATAKMWSNDVETKAQSMETKTIPAASDKHAGLESAADKILVDGSVQRKNIADGKVLTDVTLSIDQTKGEVVGYFSSVEDGKVTTKKAEIPAATDKHAGLMTVADKTEQAAIRSEFNAFKTAQLANNETQQTEIDDLEDRATELESELVRVEEELTAEIERVETDLNEKIDQVETDLSDEIARVEAELEAEDERIEAELEAALASETARAIAAEATLIKKASIRSSEGIQKILTAITPQVVDTHELKVTEWSSDVEGGDHSFSARIFGEHGISFEQSSRDSFSISGVELEEDIAEAEERAIAHANAIVDEERFRATTAEEKLTEDLEAETKRATATEDDIRLKAFQKASIPQSGNGRKQLLTAIELIPDATGTSVKWSAFQHSVDEEGNTKVEEWKVPEAGHSMTGLLRSEDFRLLMDRDVESIPSNASKDKYPTSYAVRQLVIDAINGVGQYSGTYDYIGKLADIEALGDAMFPVGYSVTAISLTPSSNAGKIYVGIKHPGEGWSWSEISVNNGDWFVGRQTAGSFLGNSGTAVFNADKNILEFNEDRERKPDNITLSYKPDGSIGFKLRELLDHRWVLNSTTSADIEHTPEVTVKDAIVEIVENVAENSKLISDNYIALDSRITTLDTKVDSNKAAQDGINTAQAQRDILQDQAMSDGDAASLASAKAYTDVLRANVNQYFPKKAENATITGVWKFDKEPVFPEPKATKLEHEVLAARVTVNESDIDSLEAITTDHGTRITGLEGRMDIVEDRLDAAEALIITHTNQINTINALLPTYVTKISFRGSEYSPASGVVTIPGTDLVDRATTQDISGEKTFKGSVIHDGLVTFNEAVELKKRPTLNGEPIISAPVSALADGIYTLQLQVSGGSYTYSWVLKA